MNLEEDELNKGFWNITDKYKLDNDIINIKDKNNQFKTSFPINHLFTLLNNNLNFCINYTLIKNCRFCNEKKEDIIYLPSLIPISLNEITDNNIKSKLLSLTSPYFTRCPKCSYLDDELLITFEEYETCLNCISTQIKYPHFLIFYFDLGNDIDISVLEDNRKNIANFIRISFDINKKNYRLIGVINIPTNNHYTTTLINYNNTINNVELKGNFNYDDLNIPPILQKIEKNFDNDSELINCICLNNIYILLYEYED